MNSTNYVIVSPTMVKTLMYVHSLGLRDNCARHIKRPFKIKKTYLSGGLIHVVVCYL